jgi:hypothetical protein
MIKQCSKCSVFKAYSEFSPDKRVPSGCQSRCKSCNAEHKRIKHSENPEHYRRLVAESTARHYEKKLNRNTAYRKNNPDKVYLWKKLDRQKNKDRVNSNNALHRASKNIRTVSWANLEQIKSFYVTANGLSMLTGDWYHVDHIIPLNGKNVCGLHVENNLQILTAKENLKKGNNYERFIAKNSR